nr:MAG TPA: hypothetical protein [Caudoviricetes sp.]
MRFEYLILREINLVLPFQNTCKLLVLANLY